MLPSLHLECRVMFLGDFLVSLNHHINEEHNHAAYA
jgi:hypothetical protein